MSSRRSESPRAGAARRSSAWAVALLVLCAAGACSNSGTAVKSPFSTSPPVLEHGPVEEVKVIGINGLGPVLVDGQGITLYMFETARQG